MPTLRGERFSVAGDEFSLSTDEDSTNQSQSKGITSNQILGDILERTASTSMPPIPPCLPCPPTLKGSGTVTGWPMHRKRYVKKEVPSRTEPRTEPKTKPRSSQQSRFKQATLSPISDKQAIGEQNDLTLAAMSYAQIKDETNELLEDLDGPLKAAFMRRLAKNSSQQDNRSMMHQKSGHHHHSCSPTSQNHVSFVVNDHGEHSTDRGHAESHSIPPPVSLSHTHPLVQTKALGRSGERCRPNCDRKVSFTLPDEQKDDSESTSTALSHSITGSSPIPHSLLSNLSVEERNSKSGIMYSHADQSHSAQSTISPSVAAPPTSPSSVTMTDPTHGVTSHDDAIREANYEISKSSIVTGGEPSHDSKVSFSLPDINQTLAEKPTATKHSLPVSASVDTDADAGAVLTSPERTVLSDAARTAIPRRPLNINRKVSFADADNDDDIKSTASHHSLGATPKLESVATINMIETGIHFPKPQNVPDLDPHSDTFLSDLHQKFFPDLAHDPSKLDWMKAIDPGESIMYDPSQDSIHPKDIRFSFKGNIIPPSKSHLLPSNLGLHHHGDAPDAAGYTIAELSHLARSTYPGQRCIAIQTLGRILYRLGIGEFGNEKELKRSGDAGQRALLAHGLWQEITQGHVLDVLAAEANKDKGHRTSIALAQEAVWHWQRGGGKSPQRPAR